MRDHRLVGRHQPLARRQSGSGQRQSRAIGTADQFQHNIHVVALGEGGHIVFPMKTLMVDTAILAAVARAHRGHFDPAPGARRDKFAIRIKQPNNARTHGSQAGNSNA